MHRRFEELFFEGRGRGHGHGEGRGPGARGFMGGRGRFFGRFGGGGAGMRIGKLLTSEDLHLIILALLEEKSAHGYELIKSIEDRSSGIYTPSPGMIYPALTYLEEMDYAVSESAGTKKLFRITEKGTENLNKNRERVTETLEKLAAFGQKMAYFRDQMEQEETTDEKWGGSMKDQEKQEWRQMKTEFHELRHELKSALFEKLAAPLEEKRRVLAVLRKAIAEIRQKT